MNGKFVRDYVYFLTEKAILCKENDGQYSMSTRIFTGSLCIVFTCGYIIATNSAPIFGALQLDT